MRLAQHDDVVRALASDRSDQPLSNAVTLIQASSRRASRTMTPRRKSQTGREGASRAMIRPVAYFRIMQRLAAALVIR